MLLLELKELVVKSLSELKAVDTSILDVSNLTDVTEMLVIASGTSSRHVKALAGSVCMSAKKKGINPLGVEGEAAGDWVLVDFGDLVVHLMRPETREFYSLEKLWTDQDKKFVED